MLHLVIGEGLGLAGIGLAAGVAGAAVLSRYIATLLFGVERLDPVVYASVALTLLGAAMFACWIPARRAARVDPIVALRSD